MNNRQDAEKLFEENQSLVHWFVSRKYPLNEHDEDLKQEARIGLWNACLTWTEERGKFSTYAFACMKNYVNNNLVRINMTQKRGGSGFKSKEKHDKAQVFSIDQPVGENESGHELFGKDIVESIPDIDWVDLEGVEKMLKPKERKILRLLYAGYNKSDVANIIGITKVAVGQRVCRYIKPAVMKNLNLTWEDIIERRGAV